jgi:hypothetical protein
MVDEHDRARHVGNHRSVDLWARVRPDVEQRAVHSLGDDLGSGQWAERNRDLVAPDAAELGLRLLVPRRAKGTIDATARLVGWGVSSLVAMKAVPAWRKPR